MLYDPSHPPLPMESNATITDKQAATSHTASPMFELLHRLRAKRRVKTKGAFGGKARHNRHSKPQAWTPDIS